MDEQEKNKEHRSWKRWEFLGAFLSIFNFRPWRDLTMNKKLMPRLGDEPPLVQLDELAEEGLKEAPVRRLREPEDLLAVIDLMRFVAAKDGIITETENRFCETVIDRYRPLKSTDDQKADYITHLNRPFDQEGSLKNTCHLVKVRTKYDFRVRLIEDLYKLAYLDELEQQERHLVDKIGDLLDVKAVDIRQASFAARRVEAWNKQMPRGSSSDSEEEVQTPE